MATEEKQKTRQKASNWHVFVEHIRPLFQAGILLVCVVPRAMEIVYNYLAYKEKPGFLQKKK